MTLETITRFIVPEAAVQQTDEHLREAGRKHAECFVLWSGTVEDNSFFVRAVHVPAQTAYHLNDGVCVRVEGPELHRLNVWLFEHEQQLGVQVHSHPTEAFHSSTDDAYPIVTVRGGLSLVVPDFARAGLRGGGLATYRLGSRRWDELSPDEAGRLLLFVD